MQHKIAMMPNIMLDSVIAIIKRATIALARAKIIINSFTTLIKLFKKMSDNPERFMISSY